MYDIRETTRDMADYNMSKVQFFFSILIEWPPHDQRNSITQAYKFLIFYPLMYSEILSKTLNKLHTCIDIVSHSDETYASYTFDSFSLPNESQLSL